MLGEIVLSRVPRFSGLESRWLFPCTSVRNFLLAGSSGMFRHDPYLLASSQVGYLDRRCRPEPSPWIYEEGASQVYWYRGRESPRGAVNILADRRRKPYPYLFNQPPEDM